MDTCKMKHFRPLFMNIQSNNTHQYKNKVIWEVPLNRTMYANNEHRFVLNNERWPRVALQSFFHRFEARYIYTFIQWSNSLCLLCTRVCPRSSTCERKEYRWDSELAQELDVEQHRLSRIIGASLCDSCFKLGLEDGIRARHVHHMHSSLLR